MGADPGARKPARAEDPRDETWGAALAELPLWRALLVGLSCGLLLGLLSDVVGWGGTWQDLGVMSAIYVGAFAYGLAATRRRRYALVDVFGARPSGTLAALALATTLAVLGARAGVLGLLSYLDWMPESWSEPLIETSRAAEDVAWLLLIVVLDPPVEELVFRGVLYRRAIGRMRPILAALASSLAFGALHRDIFGSTVMGFACVALARHTRSLWAPILAHALNNALAFVLEYVDDSVLGAGWIILGLQLVSLPWLAWLSWRAFGRGRPRGV